MANKDLLGVGGAVPPGQEAVRLFDPAGTFATEVPYLLADGRSLIAPIPVVNTNQTTYTSSDGSLQSSWGAPPADNPTVYPWVLESGAWEVGKYWLIGKPWGDTPMNVVTHNGEPVTHNGEYVTHG